MQLVDLFGSTRDAWLKEDLQGWLAANAIYAGLPEILKPAMERHEVFIVTTKQARPPSTAGSLRMGGAILSISPHLQRAEPARFLESHNGLAGLS